MTLVRPPSPLTGAGSGMGVVHNSIRLWTSPTLDPTALVARMRAGRARGGTTEYSGTRIGGVVVIASPFPLYGGRAGVGGSAQCSRSGDTPHPRSLPRKGGGKKTEIWSASQCTQRCYILRPLAERFEIERLPSPLTGEGLGMGAVHNSHPTYPRSLPRDGGGKDGVRRHAYWRSSRHCFSLPPLRGKGRGWGWCSAPSIRGHPPPSIPPPSSRGWARARSGGGKKTEIWSASQCTQRCYILRPLAERF